MKFGVVVFPGTWSDADCFHVAAAVFQQEVAQLWHKDTDLQGSDCVILPGGFSYGDYLRTGAIARFSPIMNSITEFAQKGGLVLGICNGFQILCESGLLPGALMRNNHLEFRCEWVHLRTETTNTPYTSGIAKGQVLRVPISHGEGNYYADSDTLSRLEDNDRVAFRYCTADGAITDGANPNGSLHNIAGIVNERRNVLGMMPHPERCCEAILGGTDGAHIFRSVIERAMGVLHR